MGVWTSRAWWVGRAMVAAGKADPHGQSGAAQPRGDDGHAVRRKGLPVTYVADEGEQHGFRRAENIVRSLEAEPYLYARSSASSRRIASARSIENLQAAK